MNYEQKYKEALERAKKLYGQGTITESLGYIFPELKESEDERIRKELINFVQSFIDIHDKPDAKRDEQYNSWIAWLEKQGEKTPVENIEPKFKVGDWVILPLGIIAHIDNLNSTDYQVTTTDDKICYLKISKQDNYRLWTIQDASAGDVLVNGSNIFIFHFINCTRLMGYCHVNIDDIKFYDDIGKNECFCTIDAVVTPATKEQRYLLFEKMKEASHEWNAEKKELKKMKVANTEIDDAYLQGICDAKHEIEKQSKKLDADEVIEWLNDNWWYTLHGAKIKEEQINKFKKDFGL